MVIGTSSIRLRPRLSHPPRRLAPAPVAALALTVLAVHWCAEDRKRIALAALAAFTLSAPFGRAALPASAALPLPPSLPAMPSLRTIAPHLRLRFPSPQPPPATTYSTSAPLAPRPAPERAAVPPPTDSRTAAVVSAATTPATRAPWQPSDAASQPYPERIEQWRPLIRQLLAEAWDEGRLDGAAATLDDDLVLALVEQESRGAPDALSPAGAIGLMQVMPFTFADMMTGQRALTCAIDRAAMWDVPSNVRAGLRYLALAMQAFGGNRYWALAAYNAGMETVAEWRAAGLYAVPPVGGYVETAAYAPAILENYLRRRPDVTMYVPERMPAQHVPGALRLLRDFAATQPPRPPEWIPRCE